MPEGVGLHQGSPSCCSHFLTAPAPELNSSSPELLSPPMHRTFLTIFGGTENQELLPNQVESNLPSLPLDLRAVKENKPFVVIYLIFSQNVEIWASLPPVAREQLSYWRPTAGCESGALDPPSHRTWGDP